MNLPKYELIHQNDLAKFEFISEGVNGNIEKVVICSEMTKEPAQVFNLGFGDKDAQTGEISDKTNSNNGDRDKVLATVAFTAYLFTDSNPDAWIYMEGSTPARTRLYQIAINTYYNEIQEDFIVLGSLAEELIEFEKTKTSTHF